MKKFVFLIAITLVCLVDLRAQQERPTTVAGAVFDRVGGWLHKVKIVAEDESGKKWETISGNNGSYYILELPFGVYKITASKERFETFTIPVYPVLKRGGRLNLDIAMMCRICPELPDLRKKLPQAKNAVPNKTATPVEISSTIR